MDVVDGNENEDYPIGHTAMRLQSNDRSLFKDGSQRSFSDDGSIESEESVKFDVGYLQRLQARSMPKEVKKMLSGQNLMLHRSAHSDSSDDLSLSSDLDRDEYRKVRRVKR